MCTLRYHAQIYDSNYYIYFIQLKKKGKKKENRNYYYIVKGMGLARLQHLFNKPVYTSFIYFHWQWIYSIPLIMNHAFYYILMCQILQLNFILKIKNLIEMPLRITWNWTINSCNII